MNKIPVGRTISYAYNFAFGSLGTIIGLVWLPLVILTLLNFLPSIVGDGADGAGQSALAKLSEGVGNLAVFLLTALLYAVIYTAVTRQALGLRQGGATVHFALGMPEFRMFGAILLLMAVYLVFFIVYSGAVLTTAAGGAPALEIAATIVMLLGGAAVVYALIRISFLLFPVTVAEEQVSLLRGWALTGGNFWRIFAVLLAVALPINLVFGAGAFALMAKDILAPISAGVVNNEMALAQHFADIFRKHEPELIGLQLILQPFSFGLIVGASAFAYRAVARDVSKGA